jgi:hypothetical protein
MSAMVKKQKCFFTELIIIIIRHELGLRPSWISSNSLFKCELTSENKKMSFSVKFSIPDRTLILWDQCSVILAYILLIACPLVIYTCTYATVWILPKGNDIYYAPT